MVPVDRRAKDKKEVAGKGAERSVGLLRAGSSSWGQCGSLGGFKWEGTGVRFMVY